VIERRRLGRSAWLEGLGPGAAGQRSAGWRARRRPAWRPPHLEIGAEVPGFAKAGRAACIRRQRRQTYMFG
jgi:hypothetical protein